MAANRFQGALNRSNAKFKSAARTRASGGQHPGSPPGSEPPNRATGSSNSGGSSTTTTAPPATPFLTPAQQAALSNWNTKYGSDMATLDQRDVDSLAKYNQGVSTDTQRNAQGVDVTNQNMAARGMFTSSIRDGALNDLASSLQQQLNILQTNYHSMIIADQTARNAEVGQNAAQQDFYSAQAVANAQALPPDTTTTTTPAPPAAPPAAPQHQTTNGATTTNPATGGQPLPPGPTPGTGAVKQTQGASVGPRSNGPSHPFQAALNAHNSLFSAKPPGMGGAARIRMGGGGLGNTGTLRGGG